MTTTAPPPAKQPMLRFAKRPDLRYPRAAATIAAAIGVVMTALGAGISIRYLTKAGLSSTVFLGLLTLLVGFALLLFVSASPGAERGGGGGCGSSPGGGRLLVMWSLAIGRCSPPHHGQLSDRSTPADPWPDL